MEPSNNFLIAQILGIVALIVLVISWQQEKKKALLHCQIVSGLLFSIQYLFLHAYTGAIIHFLSAVRNFVFSRYPKRAPLSFLILILGLGTFLSLLNYDGWISLFPLIAYLLYGTAVWIGNLLGIRLANVISDLLGILYNFYVAAYVSLVTSVIELFSTLVSIYRFHIKKRL